MEQKDENADFANLAKIIDRKRQQFSQVQIENEYEGCIPDWIFDDLPPLLKESSDIFKNKRERDVYLTGALTVLGGAFHNLYAYNSVDRKRVACNLLSFILGLPASGKGALNFAGKLIRGLDEYFRLDNDRKIIIPANSSSAGMLQILAENEGVGIMIETEIDTLVNTNKQDWGNTSDLSRKAFENEPYTLYRKTNKEYISIKEVKYSSVLSGTPEQFQALMYSASNGLFSRGCYYAFKDVNEKLECYGRYDSTIDLGKKFGEFSDRLLECYKLIMTKNFIAVVFKMDQLSQIQSALQNEFDHLKHTPALHANVKRSFVIALKIASIFCCLDMCENKNIKARISCPPKFLKMAINLMLTYLSHAYNVFDLLPEKTINKGKGVTVNMQRLLSVLPNEFSRAQAVELGKGLKLHTKTIDNILKTSIDKKILERIGHGNFKKSDVR